MLATYLIAGFTGATAVVMVVTYALTRRETRRDRDQRQAVKELYGELMDELTRSLLYNAGEDEYLDWWLRTMRLTEATLGRGEQHWVMEPIPGGMGVDDSEEKRLALLKAMHLRLQELIVRLDSMQIEKSFDAQAWRRGPDYKAPA